jgi:acetone carboxylase gamma subunit
MIAARRESRVSFVYPHAYDDEMVRLWEFFCPECGILLECEVGRPGDEPLIDELVRWPEAIQDSDLS